MNSRRKAHERKTETWRKTAEKERKELGFNTWTEASRVAERRKKWSGLVHGPILHRERRK